MLAFLQELTEVVGTLERVCALLYFDTISLEVTAEKGRRPGMPRDQYENTVREAFRRLGIEPEEDITPPNGGAG